MEVKRRFTTALISGSYSTPVGGANLQTTRFVESQQTRSTWTGWPLVQVALAQYARARVKPHHVFTHHDWGAAFITERNRVFSNLSDHSLSGQRGSTRPLYSYNHKGPALLGGSFTAVSPFYTDLQLSNAEQELWMQGARAIRSARPNKPALDIPVLVGELRREGIPTIIGSLMSRSKTVRDVFRQGGKEYLNIQFGWAPLVRDLIKLLELIPESRRRIEQYERDIDRLVRRRYHFPDQITTNNTLSFAPGSSSYLPLAGTPWGAIPQDNISFAPSGQAPEQVNQTTVKTWFSGGFRFYHRSVPKALEELSLLEEKANLLLGTRLDPEILYNLTPWTWLADWFVNFGDAVSNASALLSDDLVMQYGYLMRTTSIETTVVWPQGLYYAAPTGSATFVWKPRSPREPFIQTNSRVIKQRGKASPFGFGLNPSDFSVDQWAILAALGISRV